MNKLTLNEAIDEDIICVMTCPDSILIKNKHSDSIYIGTNEEVGLEIPAHGVRIFQLPCIYQNGIYITGNFFQSLATNNLDEEYAEMDTTFLDEYGLPHPTPTSPRIKPLLTPPQVSCKHKWIDTGFPGGKRWCTVCDVDMDKWELSKKENKNDSKTTIGNTIYIG